MQSVLSFKIISIVSILEAARAAVSQREKSRRAFGQKKSRLWAAFR
jgi:hypothetical protein